MTLFCLHYLGGSAREWTQVAERLGTKYRIVAIDLPGFGNASATTGYTVTEMAETVSRTISAEAPSRWAIVGHSMGAKVAAAIARSVEDGTNDLPGLIGIVLVAGSPPSPEPMSDDDRRTMMGWFAGDANASRTEARGYIAKNGGPKLGEAEAERSVSDVLRADRAAWEAWLSDGSREDWSQRVGVLQTPALVIAGADDENLGPGAQRRLTAPHFASVRLATLAGAKHLLPMESPDELASLIDDHLMACGAAATTGDAYRALIASDRVSRGTRHALLARAQPDDPQYEPAAMNEAALATLRGVVDRVVPQTDDVRIDLAARIDAQLEAAVGDGWRFANLPPDAEAYRLGLLTLDAEAKRRHGRDFVALDDDAKDSLLYEIAAGTFASPAAPESAPQRLDAAQMRSWFEDVRGDAVKLYVGHPATLSRMGYSGIANGGDGTPKTGFARVGLGEREAWEPIAATDRSQ